jgi:hypothetical protein
MFHNVGAAMFNEQWKRIAEAARRCNAFDVCEEALIIACENGINLRVSEPAVHPTMIVGAKPLAIVITPCLFAPRPGIVVTVLGRIDSAKDLLESQGYQCSDLGWIKRLLLEEDADEALVRVIFSAVEEALSILKTLIQSSLSEVEKSLLVLAKLKAQG